MPKVTNAITISRKIEDVFAVLTNVENTGNWFPGNVEEHWTSPPPHGVGSTRHAVVTAFGRRTENEAVVTEYDPPHRAVMKGISPNAQFVVTFTFLPDGAGTRVKVTSEIALRGAMRIIGPAIAGMFGLAMGRGLARLKRMMESGAP
jgi:uncharacterized protein YndB with AHSA1/START domain